MERERPKTCSICGRKTSRYYAAALVEGGICSRCYHISTGRNPRLYKRRERPLSKSLSPYDLEREYVVEGRSLRDLGWKYGYSAQHILKLLNRYGIKTRNASSAVALALSKGNITATRFDELGIARKHPRTRRVADVSFFKAWTPAMAYVLGVIYTDGSLTKGRFSVAQKEPELLKKIRSLMGSNAEIVFTEKRGITGALYRFQICNSEIYADLLRLGLFPNKSLSLSFPQVPAECVRHFIRGCWDGDGSVFVEPRRPFHPGASYCSGSKPFIEALADHLVELGLPDRTIHVSTKGRKHPIYSFRFTGRDCASLYHVLYDGVEESMYLTRKHEKFRKIAHDYEWDGFQGTEQRSHHRQVKSNKSLSDELRLAINALKREQETYTSEAQSTRENPPSRPA